MLTNSIFVRFNSIITNNKIVKNINFKFLLLLLFVYLFFVCLWVTISLYRLYNMYSAVYDLGISIERLWLPFHSSINFFTLMRGIFTSSIVPYLFSPISLPESLPFILVIQTLFIWASVFPLYFISRYYKLSPLNSLLISLLFFFYFPIAGINFFDFHMLAFFPFFFLLSYAFYVYRHFRISILFFAITALVKFPFSSFFVTLFALEELVALYFITKNTVVSSRDNILVTVIIFLISGGFLLYGFYILFSAPHSVSEYLHISTTTVFPLGDVVVTAIMLFGTILFLPLYSKKWAIYLVIYIIFISISNQVGYFFPDILTDQYSATFVAFVFLGIIDVLANKEFRNRKTKTESRLHFKRVPVKSNSTTRVLLLLLTVLAVVSISFQPWSPIVGDNNYVGDIYYPPPKAFNNYQTYYFVNEISNMIPRSNPYVLVNNNIPEIFPRAAINGPFGSQENIVMGFPSPVFENVTEKDATNNTFPFINFDGSVSIIPLDYALATINSAYANSISGYQTELDIMNVMFESGKYGIVAEANGTILIERNYYSPPDFYIPLCQVVGVNQGDSQVSHKVLGNSLLFNNISKGGLLWSGGSNIYPGTYNITVHFYISPKSYGNITVTEMLNDETLNETSLNIQRNAILGGPLNLNLNEEIKSFGTNGQGQYNNLYYFVIQSNGWIGNITFCGITEKEISYEW